MPEGRTRKTGQHDRDLVRALAEANEAKKAVLELTERVEALEDELALLKAKLTPLQTTPPRGAAERVSSTKQDRLAPPPLPRVPTPSGPRSTKGGTPAFIDISEMAELVDSSPPPPRRGK